MLGSRSGTAMELDQALVRTLATQVRGEVVRSGDPAHEEARTVWNGMIDRRPALIVRAIGV
jgi:hypothetical protein